MCRISKVFVILILTNVCFVYGRRGGGGSRGGSRGGGYSHSSSHSYSHSSPSYSHPSYSHPSPSYSHPSPSYSHPSPSYSHPSPSYSHPSPSYSHPSPSYSHPSISHPASLSYPAYKPLPSAPVYRPIGWNTQSNTNTRPIGFGDSHPGPVGPPKQSSTLGSSSSNNAPAISRPIGFVPPGSPGHSTGAVGPPKTVAGVGNTPSGGHYGERPPAYNPHYNPAGYGSPSTGYNFPPPAYSPAGHPAYSPGSYHAPPAYSPGSYHAPPAYTPHASPGVTVINNNYHPPAYVPTYHYSTTDTGSGNLGFFLGYSLGRLTSPSFHYHSSSYYDPIPRYDHYTVHHYYHNSNAVPKEATIQPNAVVTCVGDTGSFCPSNTTSLCTNNGAVMCVASASTTVPCTDVQNTNCVKSMVPCLNNTSPECAGTLKKTTDVTIPCISTAKIFANVSYVNNSVVIVDTNSTSIDINSTTTVSTVTTTPQPTTPQTFCVTILALPAERKIPENEKVIEKADQIFGSFATKVLGLA
ncbi:uncharacterized protein LOC130452358 isoform X2 [Diorhabda sublineata]|uniref:uncharacterized protein LOC130452358 isoform X2 n=1 Tax=Diorhabda sublineata TaxID=1163346 RepID=UPI0024E07782|nr:uncharacterized protein LOC130452358 isoform X2 [Diorhabda sublineata]